MDNQNSLTGYLYSKRSQSYIQECPNCGGNGGKRLVSIHNNNILCFNCGFPGEDNWKYNQDLHELHNRDGGLCTKNNYVGRL